MKLIVGLGNPGEKYADTRHNVGFWVVEELARKFSIFNFKFSIDTKANALSLRAKRHGEDLILVKPQTMMNASGFAVKKLITYYKLPITSLWVIHDDLDLPLGKMKIVIGHSSAGHHGIDSIVEQLGTTDFVRFRIGIGNPIGKPRLDEVGEDTWQIGGGKIVSEKVKRHEVIDFVLEKFEGKDTAEASKVVKKTVKAIELALEKGLERAMNTYNSK